MPKAPVGAYSIDLGTPSFIQRRFAITANGHWYLLTVGSGLILLLTKSTDQGKTWTDVAELDAAIGGACLWYDRWTPGDSGDKIHMWWYETTTDDVYYRNIDTSTDTLGSVITVLGTLTSATQSGCISGTKCRGGNLNVLFDIDGGTEVGMYRSTDGGGTWGVRTSAVEGGSPDHFLAFPGGDADTQDFWILYFDTSASEMSLKVHDDSADTNSEASIAGSITVPALSTAATQWDGFVRDADNHLIVFFWTIYDNAAADLKCYDITNAGTITAKTDVVLNSDDCYGAAAWINQSNDAIRVYYCGKSDGSQTANTAVQVSYKESTDGGATWGSEQILDAALWGIRGIGCDKGSGQTQPSPCIVGRDNNVLYLLGQRTGGPRAGFGLGVL